MKKLIAVFCGIMLQAMWAGPGGAETHTDVSVTVSSMPEAQFAFAQSFVLPFLRGEGPLTEGNNISLKLGANISPISFNFLFDTVWTPVAFFNLSLGIKAGSGWNYRLFGTEMKGMGLYRYRNDKDPPEGTDTPGLNGLVQNTHGGATLQFDFAALFPGEWHHVLMQVYNEISYKSYTGAKGGQRWYYENDDGINQNSFAYYSSALLGYQMPLFIDLAGIMVELSKPFFNPASGEGISSGPAITLSLAADFKPLRQFNVMALGQWRNRLIHPVTEDYRRQWGFYRVALIASYRLK